MDINDYLDRVICLDCYKVFINRRIHSGPECICDSENIETYNNFIYWFRKENKV